MTPLGEATDGYLGTTERSPLAIAASGYLAIALVVAIGGGVGAYRGRKLFDLSDLNEAQPDRLELIRQDDEEALLLMAQALRVLLLMH